MEQIGLAAVLDMSDFNSNMAKYDAALGKMDKTTADAAGKVGQQFVGLGDAVNKAALVVATAFVAATAAAGVALVKFTTDGISKAADLESQMSAIAAVMTKTKEEVEPLKELILDLAIDPKLKVNTFEAAEAIQMLGRNGLTMTEILDGAARSTVLLANATDADFGVAADIATKVMSLFNIEAEDMNKAVDGVTSVVNESTFTIDDYALALAQSGGVAGAVGVEFDDFNAVIAGTSPAFASGSDAGTSFKTFLQRLVPDTKEAAGTMRELGLFTGLTKDEFQKAEKDIAKYEEQLAKLDPTSKNAAEKQSELETKIRVLKSSLDEGRNAFFHVDGSMRDMNEIAGLLQGALSGLSEEQKITALGAIFQADAQRTANELAKLGEQGFTDLKAVMANTSAEEAAAIRMDNLKAAMEILAGTVEALQFKIGDKFLPILQSLAERLNALVVENEAKLLAFFSGVADWVGEKVPLAMDWLVKTGLPAMADAFNYLTDTVFPGIAKSIAWAVENWDFLSGAIKVLAGVLITASLVSTFAGIAAAVTPLITLISGAGGIVAAIAGGGGLVATLLGLLTPVGWVVAAVGGLALAWMALSKDTESSAVAMRESAERETRQMAVVTGETFGAWAESVAGYHRKMKDESGLTLDEMIDNINADFWQMRQDVETSSGKMSQKAIDEMERMRLGAIKQASEMKTGVEEQSVAMADESGIAMERWSDEILDEIEFTKEIGTGRSQEMKDAIVAELDDLRIQSVNLSQAQKQGILDQLDDMKIRYEDGTSTWKEGTLERIRELKEGAIEQASGMKTGVGGEMDAMAAAADAASAEFSQTILSDAVATRQGAVGDMEKMNISITDELTRLEAAATGSSAAMKTGILAELNSLRIQHADGTTTWKDGTLEKIRGMTDAAIQDAGRMKTGVSTAVQYMKDGAMLSVEQMANGIKEDARGMELSATESARLLRIGMEGQLLELKNNSGNLSAGQKDLILRNLDSMTVEYADGSIGWKNDAIETAGGLKTGVITAAGGMKTGVITAVGDMKTDTVSDMRTMASDSKLAASQQATDVKEEYVTMRGLVADELETMSTDNKTDGKAAGKSVADGVKEGVEGNSGGVFSSLRTLASDMWNAFKEALGIKSPSTVFYEIGTNIVQGLVNALMDGTSLVNSTLLSLGGQFSSFGGAMAKRFGDSLSPMKDELTSITGEIDVLAKSAEKDFKTKLATHKSELKTLQDKQAAWQADVDAIASTNPNDATTGIIKNNIQIQQLWKDSNDLVGVLRNLPGDLMVNGVNQNEWAAKEREKAAAAYYSKQAEMSKLIKQNDVFRTVLNGWKNIEHYTSGLDAAKAQVVAMESRIAGLSAVTDRIEAGSSMTQALLEAAMNPSEELKKQREYYESIKKLFPDVTYEQAFGPELAVQEELYALFQKQLDIKRKLADEQKIIDESEAATSQLKLLQEQIDFIDFIRKQGLDPAELLGGVQLGKNADTSALTQAMSAATREISDKLEQRLLSGKGGVSVVDRIADIVGKASGFAKSAGDMLLGQSNKDVSSIDRQIEIARQNAADLKAAEDAAKANPLMSSNERLRIDMDEDAARARILTLEQERLSVMRKQEEGLENLVALQEKQNQFNFLKQQMDLVAQVTSQGLDPASIFQGVSFGLGADINGIVAGMSNAVQAMVSKMASGLSSGDALTETLRKKLGEILAAIDKQNAARNNLTATMEKEKEKLDKMTAEQREIASLPVTLQQEALDKFMVQYEQAMESFRNADGSWSHGGEVWDMWQEAKRKEEAKLAAAKAVPIAIQDTPEMIAQRQVIASLQASITGEASALNALLAQQAEIERQIAAYKSTLNTGDMSKSVIQKDDGGLDFSALTGAISGIANALRQMQTGSVFNVNFQGSSGNTQVLQDIQFLNSLYGTP